MRLENQDTAMTRISPGSGTNQGPQPHSAARDRQGRRARILFADADTLRGRVQDAADELRLRGARMNVLTAALDLLCRWARVADDRVRLHQISELLAERDIQHDAKTIGRALKDLATSHQLLEYIPARGRGAHATIAVHPRFRSGIHALRRDEDGKVVTFSSRTPYISKGVKNPPTPQADPDQSGRPMRLKTQPGEVGSVLSQLPAVYRDMPRHLRWLLGGEIRRYLQRGWKPEQIIEILQAPVPGKVERPLRLAKWRLSHNMLGTGPRLAALQRAWDLAQRSHDDTERAQQQRDRWTALLAATTADVRNQMLAALRARLRPKFGADPVVDEREGMLHACTMARREFPEHPLSSAIATWLAANTPEPGRAEHTPAPAPLAALHEHDSNSCVSCAAAPGQIRPELPLPTPVCDDCWTRETTDLDIELAA